MHAFEMIGKARAALASETRVDLRYAPVEVDAAGDALVLRGEIEGIEAKRVALDAVQAVPGLPRVVDELRVRPAVPQGDSAVRDEVYTRLVQEPAFEGVSISCRVQGGEHALTRAASRRRGHIDITISDGVVALRGRVEGPVDKYFAGALAWKNSGTRDVVNELEVADATFEQNDTIRSVLQRLCERNALLRHQPIEASVEDGVVTLRGRVTTAAAKQLMQHDVWYIDGVRDVVNEIEAG